MMEQRICQYSNYSLQFYLCFPLILLGNTYFKSNFYTYICAIGTAPSIIYLLAQLADAGHLKLEKHSETDHIHSSQQTLGVIWRSLLLGSLLTVGLAIIIHAPPEFLSLGLYLCTLSFFHFSEYFVTSLSNPTNLSTDIFLINQSNAYTLATLASFAEFFLEFYFLPYDWFGQFKKLTLLGLLVCLIGELMRKLAILTAGQGFTHIISTTRHPEHVLITHGVYSLMRHPSYAGWFYWALGTQMILLNPICFVLFMFVAWNFFQERIPYEEDILITFFGQDYHKYRNKVPVGIPFIKT